MTTLDYHPTSSFSSSLRPHSQPSNPNYALPTLNFNFDALRSQMGEFTARFDDFLERGRKRVLDERNAYRQRVGEVTEQTHATARAITTTTSALQAHSSTLSAQATETQEMSQQIASLSLARDNHLKTVASLRAKLAETQKAAKERKEEIKKWESYMGGMQTEDSSEVAVWEDLLGVSISKAGGANSAGGDDKLKFAFRGLNLAGQQNNKPSMNSRGKEASFVLDVGKAGYEVLVCEPELEKEEVDVVMREMRENEDLARFLKGMRGLFVKQVGGV